jgi:hypothetical protein
MSYTEIARLRDLFARDLSPRLLNNAQRLILITITTYEGEKGCYVGSKRLEDETGLGARAFLKNMHYLADGSKWEHNKRVPCSSSDCIDKDIAHLNIIKRNARAYKGTQQNYRVDLNQYERLLSMRDGAPFSSVIDLQSVPLDTVEHAPESVNVRATVHPYKQDKHNKQQQESSYVISFNKLIKAKVERSKVFHADGVIVDLLDKLEAKSFTYNAVERALEAVGGDWVKSPKAFAIKALQTLLEGEPDWNMNENKPPHCGECDPITRKLPYRYYYRSNPEGGNTDQCDKCNPYSMGNERV